MPSQRSNTTTAAIEFKKMVRASHTPQQPNSYDCGPFVLCAAQAIVNAFVTSGSLAARTAIERLAASDRDAPAVLRFDAETAKLLRRTLYQTLQKLLQQSGGRKSGEATEP